MSNTKEALFEQRKHMIAHLAAEIPGCQEYKALVAMQAFGMLLDGSSMFRVLGYIDSYKLEQAA